MPDRAPRPSKDETSSREWQKRAKERGREKAVMAKEHDPKNSHDGGSQERRGERADRLLERLSLRLEGKKLKWEIATTIGIFLTAVVAIVAVIDVHFSSEKQLALATDNEHRTLRAYIGIRLESVVPQTGANPFIAKLKISNEGLTPAFSSRVSTTMELVDIPLDERFAFPYTTSADAAAISGSRMVIQPRQVEDHEDRMYRYLSAAELAEIGSQGSRHALVAYGTNWYRDIFGTDRWTEFCFMLVPYARVGSRQIAGFAGQPCHRHNSTDESGDH